MKYTIVGISPNVEYPRGFLIENAVANKIFCVSIFNPYNKRTTTHKCTNTCDESKGEIQRLEKVEFPAFPNQNVTVTLYEEIENDPNNIYLFKRVARVKSPFRIEEDMLKSKHKVSSKESNCTIC